MYGLSGAEGRSSIPTRAGVRVNQRSPRSRQRACYQQIGWVPPYGPRPGCPDPWPDDPLPADPEPPEVSAVVAAVRHLVDVGLGARVPGGVR